MYKCRILFPSTPTINKEIWFFFNEYYRIWPKYTLHVHWVAKNNGYFNNPEKSMTSLHFIEPSIKKLVALTPPAPPPSNEIKGHIIHATVFGGFRIFYWQLYQMFYSNSIHHYSIIYEGLGRWLIKFHSQSRI